MPSHVEAVTAHYDQAGLVDRIRAALERLGPPVNTRIPDALAAFDAFHLQGRVATRALARRAGLRAGEHVLDLGCGLGGPARTLAAENGCRVVGLDLVEAYCRAAALLTDWMGLGGKVVFRQGDASALPFEAASFDVVWMQHVTMNVADKTRLFAEARRVLRPGGRVALHEVTTGPAGTPHFPVPWAGEASISFLMAPAALRKAATGAGLDVRIWRDVTAASLAWMREADAARPVRPEVGSPLLGLSLLMGETTNEKLANVVRNLEEKRIGVVQGVLPDAKT